MVTITHMVSMTTDSTIKVDRSTRTWLKTFAASKDMTYDEAINHLLDSEQGNGTDDN